MFVLFVFILMKIKLEISIGNQSFIGENLSKIYVEVSQLENPFNIDIENATI